MFAYKNKNFNFLIAVYILKCVFTNLDNKVKLLFSSKEKENNKPNWKKKISEY